MWARQYRYCPAVTLWRNTRADISSILTHTHIDHVGAIADFPHAPMVVAAAERAYLSHFTGVVCSQLNGRTHVPPC